MASDNPSVASGSPSACNTVPLVNSRPVSPTTTPTAVCYASRLNASEIAVSVYDSLSQLMDCGGSTQQGEQRGMEQDSDGDTDIVSVIFLILILILSAVAAIGTVAVLICLIKFKQSKINTTVPSYDLK